MRRQAVRVEFNRSLQKLRDDVLKMGSMVCLALPRAIQALKNSDTDLAQQIISEDEAINQLRFEIEECCLLLITRHQPVASDLRTVLAATNIALELERMGDHAKGIAVIVQNMQGKPPLKPLIDIPRMADISCDMLHQSLQAFLEGDAGLAQAVVERDEEVDQLYAQIFRELISFIVEDPAVVTRATFLLFAAHNLERVADRVTNICERVIFLSTGRLEEFPSGSPNISSLEFPHDTN